MDAVEPDGIGWMRWNLMDGWMMVVIDDGGCGVAVMRWGCKDGVNDSDGLWQ